MVYPAIDPKSRFVFFRTSFRAFAPGETQQTPQILFMASDEINRTISIQWEFQWEFQGLKYRYVGTICLAICAGDPYIGLA